MAKEYYRDDYVVEYQGHVLEVLKELEAESVHMCMTSSPYFGLRDYDLEPQVWDDSGGCEHEWGDERVIDCGNAPSDKSTLTTNAGQGPLPGNKYQADQKQKASQGQFCQKCKAWLGSLGNEPTIDLYLSHLVLIFREVKRVLRNDGTLWIVIGDSYAGGGGASGHTKDTENLGRKTSSYGAAATGGRVPSGLKPKDLCGIPWKLAFAFRDDGWWLRSDVIWQKPSCMPESVSGWMWEKHRIKVKPSARAKKGSAHSISQNGVNNPQGARDGVNFKDHSDEYQDCPGCDKCEPNDGYVLRKGSWRPTSSHEYVFMLAKSEKYFADGEAVSEKHQAQGDKSAHAFGAKLNFNGKGGQATQGNKHSFHPVGRNLRSVLTADDTLNEFLRYCHETFGWNVKKAVDAFIDGQSEKKDVWTINPEPTLEAHFASFPSRLCEIAIKCSTSERGCCPKCGVSWVRIIERRILEELKDNPYCEDGQLSAGKKAHHGTHHSTLGGQQDKISFKTIGWKPSCECRITERKDQATHHLTTKAPDPIPCTILDPFSGSGRALTTARRLGRKAIGIDLKPEYLEMPLEELRRLDRWERKSFKM